ncbi:hypothetical protein ACDW34_12470 [Acinetobacter piscicola]|uniref:hypothetical protein n=1 Tax=Acinetobacter piscicola TaxID=2006115 RepID=UPI003556BCCA
MNDWYQQNTNELTQIIVNEFTFIYQKYRGKNQHIYAYALKINDKVIIARSVISTLEMLKKEHYGLKWQTQSWGAELNDGDVDDNLDHFNKKMIERYWTEIGPLIQKGHDIQIEIEKNLVFYIHALKQAKQILVNKFGDDIEHILFYISVRDHPKSEIQSALAVNSASELLNEFIEFKQSQS